jgi:hypothetical protein
MGALADLLANAKAFDTTLPREGKNRAITKKIQDILNRLGDQDYPSGMAAANEVQGIAIFNGTVTGGTYTLTFNLHNGVIFTTAAIGHSANNSVIQSAIDVAAAPVVPGWTNGSIPVTGGPLTTTPLAFTFSGASVSQQNHPLITGNGASLTGGTLGAITQTTAGQPLRTGMATLIALGILRAPAPPHGATTGFLVQNRRGGFPHGLDEGSVRAIIEQVGVEEKSAAVAAALLAAVGY